MQASRFLEKRKSDPKLEPNEAWDESVIGLLNYPDVVEMMNEDLDWTWKLGEAVVNDQPALMDAVQRFRAQVDAAGNLESNDKVVVEKKSEGTQQVIVIQSASPDVIYVPTYQPSVVVVRYAVPVLLLLLGALPVLLQPNRRLLDGHVRRHRDRLWRGLGLWPPPQLDHGQSQLQRQRESLRQRPATQRRWRGLAPAERPPARRSTQPATPARLGDPPVGAHHASGYAGHPSFGANDAPRNTGHPSFRTDDPARPRRIDSPGRRDGPDPLGLAA